MRFSLFAVVLLVQSAAAQDRKDHHSYATPEHVRVKHVDLSLEVDFERRVLKGHATLSVEQVEKGKPLVLDSRNLRVTDVGASTDGKDFKACRWGEGKADDLLGARLEIVVPDDVRTVRIAYSTAPTATGLQWMDREKTASKKHPFLYSQSQAIHARSWIPLQDSPAVRITYTARIKTPKGLLAVMSASNDPKAERTGDYSFEMKQAVPPYLIALAVGDLEFRPVGKRTGVYAEPGVAEKAAREFSDMEKMLETAEGLYGPYRWDRYDVLVLPPSFPFGGMENPRLTFASPTILAGDKSLVSLVAHELAHSWSGNLVSNATWRDFWLNEGFTVYVERRIMEKVYGKARADMEAVLGRRGLERELADMKPENQVLAIDLKGRDPEDGLTGVPYEKGALFLRHIEKTVGREKFDPFLRSYFDHFAFKSITTEDFLAYLDKHLVKGDKELAEKLAVKEWVYKPGIPGTAPALTAEKLTRAEEHAKAWAAGKVKTADLKTDDWTTHEWLHFLRQAPEKLGVERMKELDAAFKMTEKGNSEIVFEWLMLAVKNDYEPAYRRLEQFLTSQGRRKFLRPLYEELMKTDAGKERARAIYRKARPTYHPIAVGTIDAVVKWKE